MKKLILSIATLAISATSMAQSSPYDVCEAIRTSTTFQDRVTSCMAIITRNQIDPTIVPLLTRLAKENTTETLKALQAAANQGFQPEATATCEVIRNQTTFKERVTSCITKIANSSFDLEALTVVNTLAKSNTTEALKAIDKVANKYFEFEALNVCKVIDSSTSFKERVTTCLDIIGDKTFAYGAAGMCANTARQNTTEALNCMRTIAMDYVPTPIPNPTPNPTPIGAQIIVEAKDINRIKAKATRAQKFMEQGEFQRANMLLQGVIQDLSDIQNSAERY